ncbi:MAG: YjjG family noncanonical pyrimidine nucleotidase [Intestinibacillus sp.]
MTILLDLDGTVLDFEQSERHAFFAAMGSFGIAVNERDFRRYHNINREMWAAIERGESTGEEIRPLRFRRTFEDRGTWDWDALNARYIDSLAGAGIPYPGAVDFVAQLHERYTVCVLTNGLRRSQENRVRQSGLLPYIDMMITSEEAGAPKPAADMFLQAMERLGSRDAAHYIMVGDSLSADIAGAQRAGVRAMWYAPSGAKPTGGIRPDWIVQSYAEAAATLLDGAVWKEKLKMI